MELFHVDEYDLRVVIANTSQDCFLDETPSEEELKGKHILKKNVV